MGQFGGYSQFGLSRFGGGTPAVLTYHRLLRAMEPPGVYLEDENTVRDDRLRVYATALAAGQCLRDQLERELFPRTSEELLPEWEELFGIAPVPGAPLAERQAGVYARWQAPQPSTSQALRMMVAELLHPTIAFWDRLDDSDVSFRWTQRPGNGAITETATELTLSASGPSAADWSETEDTCPRIYRQLVDRDDDVRVLVRVIAVGALNYQGGGVCLYKDAENALGVEVYRVGGAYVANAWVLNGGVATYGTPVAVSAPVWVEAQRVGDGLVAKYGDDPDHMVILQAFDRLWKPRFFGAFGRDSTGTPPALDLDLDDLQVRYGRGWNNVELIPTPAASLPAGGEDGAFVGFVHREPTDAGRYNLGDAQRIMDRCKQAHTLILVGESDCFRFDDPNSLFDRDVFGS